MESGDPKMRLSKEEDFIALKRFDYSLDKVRERYPDGAPAHVRAGALMISIDEEKEMYLALVEKLRVLMNAG